MTTDTAELAARFARIRRFYGAHERAILSDGLEWFGDPADPLYGDAYGWEHEGGIVLTPIERQLWHDIRAESLVLYPQYPVGRFFVDFGNPVFRVAIECDGAAWHTDLARDAARQREIEAMGWAVYRLTGKQCGTDFAEVEDEAGRVRWQAGEARVLVRSVGARMRKAREAA